MMSNEIPQEVLEAFTSGTQDMLSHAAGKTTVEKIGHGLINSSYKICCELKPVFFLQKINTHVFPRPYDVQENYIHIWRYAESVRTNSARELTGLRMPAPIYYGKQATLCVDKDDNFWRAFEWIPDSTTIVVATTPDQAKATAGAFAKFTAAYEEMNTDMLKEVIPGFHDLGLRFRQFEEALNTELYERMAVALPVINELKQRERYKHFYKTITGSEGFHRRVMHHDAKIGNILFHNETGNVICPVDYDTVMPGYFFSDIGDMVRSMAGNSDENQKDPENIFIRKDFYKAIIEGYTDVLGGQLSSSERKYLHCAGLLMIYMQALRFLTDYLNGDIYYQTGYPQQNFDRAANQLALLKSLEVFLFKEYKFCI